MVQKIVIQYNISFIFLYLYYINNKMQDYEAYISFVVVYTYYTSCHMGARYCNLPYD